MEKLKVLINSYACSPDRGSEPGMGWNWCLHLAKYSELFIITEEENRESIELFMNTNNNYENMHFYYISVTSKVRNMAQNQGDWRFYYFYKKWQKEALEVARSIIREYKIDVLHQLNMIGFREPGYLWEIEKIPFVWGPVGGLKQFPISYLQEVGIGTKFIFRLKNLLNLLQIKYSKRVNKAVKRADLLISAIPDSRYYLLKYKSRDSVHIPETGTFISNLNLSIERFYSDSLQVMWVGKFDFRKQLSLAIQTIAAVKNNRIKLNVYGGGNDYQERKARDLVEHLNISNQVVFHGNVSNLSIQQAMLSSDLLFFTSVNDDTSTVVLEAVSNQLPVLCFDAFGFGAVVDETIGCKIPLSNPKKSIIDFAGQLNMLFENRQMLEEFSKNCETLQHKYSWENKAREVTRLYHELIISSAQKHQ